MSKPGELGTGVSTWPDVIEQTSLDDGVALTLRLPAGHACFAGHFPDFPLVPGVVQIGWAVQMAAHYLQRQGDPQTLDRIKFMHPILPGDTFTLSLLQKGTGQVHFRFLKAEQVLAAGRLVYDR